MCSTFLIAKTLQASLTMKTSQLAAVNGLSPSAVQSLFLAQANATEPPLEQAITEAADNGKSFMLYVVPHILSGKVYSSLQCGQ